jgi:hypothetical protein
MKRSLIYSITVLAATGLIASCTNKTETTTTTAPEKSPAYTKKHKKYDSKPTATPKDKYDKASPTPKNKYDKASPTPKDKYDKASPTPKKDKYDKASPSPTPTPY